MLMRKLISTLLLSTILLFANMSWAMDTCAEAFFGHGAEWTQDKSPAPDDHDDDHCCHGLAHLMGLSLQTNLLVETSDSSDVVFSSQYYRTRSQAPPTPPPNA